MILVILGNGEGSCAGREGRTEKNRWSVQCYPRPDCGRTSPWLIDTLWASGAKRVCSRRVSWATRGLQVALCAAGVGALRWCWRELGKHRAGPQLYPSAEPALGRRESALVGLSGVPRVFCFYFCFFLGCDVRCMHKWQLEQGKVSFWALGSDDNNDSNNDHSLLESVASVQNIQKVLCHVNLFLLVRDHESRKEKG